MRRYWGLVLLVGVSLMLTACATGPTDLEKSTAASDASMASLNESTARMKDSSEQLAAAELAYAEAALASRDAAHDVDKAKAALKAAKRSGASKQLIRDLEYKLDEAYLAQAEALRALK